MSKYPEVVQQLVSAAVDQGMSERSQVYVIADGGNGLREALEARFSSMTFILHRPHLKQHLYEGAEAIGLNTSRLSSKYRIYQVRSELTTALTRGYLDH